ncbi:hypothetical protein SAMN05216383_12335 [Prevotella sp. KH2C16]|nr:hypothetical protein SAMN05216383_12335 [Prevotella sp. KH2C16]
MPNLSIQLHFSASETEEWVAFLESVRIFFFLYERPLKCRVLRRKVR